MIYGYVRVSTKEQHEDRQLIALSECGRKIDKIFMDKQSGKDFKRSEYQRMLKKIKKGDILIVKSIDRLGRNYNEIIEQWREITKTKNADIVVLDIPVLDTTQHKDFLGMFISDLVLQLLSYVAENERKNIIQRQSEGIAAAKAKGVKFGRPLKYDAKEYIHIYKQFKEHKITQKQAMEMIGASETTYYRIVNEIKAIIQNP